MVVVYRCAFEFEIVFSRTLVRFVVVAVVGRERGSKMNKRKLEEEIFQQNKFEKLNNIADSEDDDDDSVNENHYDVMQEQDIEGNDVHIVGLVVLNTCT